MWHLAYQPALAATLLLGAPVWLARRGTHYRPTLAERLGRYGQRPPVRRSSLWIHAVSVGEVSVARTLATQLPESLPLTVTTVTPTGQARAKSLFPEAEVSYLPFDLTGPVKRFLHMFRPRMLILTEGDLWPIVLRTCHRQGLPIAVVNGRVSDRSFQRMRKIRPLLAPLFGPVDRFGVQTEADRERLLALGVSPEKVSVTGNLKYDSPVPTLDPELASTLRKLAAGRPIIVAGSTMQGEEEQILAALRLLAKERETMLILAPRHPERWDKVAELLAQRRIPTARRSQVDVGDRRNERPAVVLLDSLGELAATYSLASAAFIGGTLVSTGGHNPLEPARFAVPIAVGPSMHNFQEMADRFDRDGAWHRVADEKQLAHCWSSWLADADAAKSVGERGKALLERHAGAGERTMTLLEPLLRRLGER